MTWLVVFAGAAPAVQGAQGPPAVASFADFNARAAKGEHLNVVFFGASLTWGANAADPNATRYRGQMMQRLAAAYPQAHFAFHDSAIGGTGSQLGIFRLDRDVLAYKPDLVFLDFSANDGIDSDQPATLAAYEAIVRRIITEAHAPVVQVIFPFKWNVNPADLPKFKRRDAHLAIAAGQITPDQIWPLDGVHPCERGYALFADAAWDGLQSAIADNRVCSAPEKMLYADTYMKNARVRISSLGPLPAGWTVGQPHRVSAYFDMLMSRWLDDVTIAANRVVSPQYSLTQTPREVAPLRLRFSARHVALFGESSLESGQFRALIDGKPVIRPDSKPTDADRDIFDPGKFARSNNGNVHLDILLADDLDPSVEHRLEIDPIFTPGAGQDLRIESICVAGGQASVRLEQRHIEMKR